MALRGTLSSSGVRPPTIRLVADTRDDARTQVLDEARALDEADPLAPLRAMFSLPNGVVYLNANSLGPLPRGVARRLEQTVEHEWGEQLSASWVHGDWFDEPVRLGDRIAPLIGARAGEVLVADTTSIALTKLVGAALAARPSRHVVLSSTDNFPSDLYVAAGAARLHGAELRVVEPGDVRASLDESVALVALTQVDFRTGVMHDLAAITEDAHRAGALVLWDLCHSAGAVPVECEAHGVDLAVGCTYKYLCAGPGSPSFLYVRQELHDTLANPLPGWLGHSAPFGFELDWHPVDGVRRFMTSTPPVLAMAALDAALDVFDGTTIVELRKKSVALADLFVRALDASAAPDLEVASPRDAGVRGAHVALGHPRAPALAAMAASRGVVGDVRPPDLCRFGMSAPSLRYEDVVLAATVLAECAHALA